MTIKTLLPICALFASATLFAQSMPAGAIQPGTLANEKLVRDVLPQMVILASTKGCQEPQDDQPYLKAQPKGKVGSRMWQEIWLIQCRNGNYPVEARFQEDATGASFHLR